MPSVPRILRSMPAGDITPCQPRPVIARLWWRSMHLARDVQAWAIGDAAETTLILWDAGSGIGVRTDPIPTRDIREPGTPYTGPADPTGFEAPYRVDPDVSPGPPRPDVQRPVA